MKEEKKREYVSPKMKTVAVRSFEMLCGSFDAVGSDNTDGTEQYNTADTKSWWFND